jgi:adenylylsulfate kinase
MSGNTGFAIWMTGLPASGKSTITRELMNKLKAWGIPAVVLESDEMRRILTPDATYSPEERDRFYRMLVRIGDLLVRSGVNVIFDATANKREYRDHARALIPRFLEVYVHCPLDVCIKRDPKGIYDRAAAGNTGFVPGVQVPYEPPINPEVTLDGQASPESAADTILDAMKRLLHI